MTSYRRTNDGSGQEVARSTAGATSHRDLVGRCICVKVTSKVDGLVYRLQAVDSNGNPAKCYAHRRSPDEMRLRQLQRRNFPWNGGMKRD